MGRKISNILKGEIVSSIFYIALGLCLLLIPDQTVNIICKVIFGLIMIAAGVYHVGIYVAEKEKSTILDLFTGVITMVLGVFLFFTPQIVIKILPYLLGAFVLVDSFWKLKGTHRLRKAELGMWKIFLIGSLIFILLGIAVMFYPFISVTKMILFCGCILTVNGAVDLVFLIMLKVGLRKAEKRRFVIAVVIAILGTLTAFSESGDGNASLVGMMIGTPMAFVLFGGIPYGWNLVSKVTRYFEWILFLPIMGWLIYFGVKLMASMCCGWFFFGRECLVRIKAKGGRG